MKLRNVLSMVLACLLTIGLAVPVHAAEVEVSGPQSSTANTIVPFASGSFNLNIPAKTSVTADTSLPLEAGDYVTIQASYAPSSAKVDFGLVAPSGTYYYMLKAAPGVHRHATLSSDFIPVTTAQGMALTACVSLVALSRIKRLEASMCRPECTGCMFTMPAPEISLAPSITQFPTDGIGSV